MSAGSVKFLLSYEFADTACDISAGFVLFLTAVC